MKYLKLNFKDAKLFLNHRATRCKQIIFGEDTDDFKSKTEPRKNGGNFKEYITVYQISNVLHKLFGERPVPTFRKVIYEKSPYLFEKAKNSLLKLSYYEYTTKKGDKIPYREFIRLDKSDYNSRVTNAVITWELVKKRFNYDDAECIKLKNIISGILGIDVSENKPYMYYVEKLRLIDPIKLTPLDDVITKSIKTHIISEKSSYEVASFGPSFGRTSLSITKGIDTYINLNGEILIPVTDDDIEKIRNNFSGTCTILDGGKISIDSILYSEDFTEDYIEDFRKVGDISTKKIYL